MQVSEQMGLGMYLLGQLNSLHPTVLAGGAPRDWDDNRLANDLDFFVMHRFDPDEVSELLGVELHRKGEVYEGSEFVVYETEINEQVIQVIHHLGKTDVSSIINDFPCSLSQVWFSPEGHLKCTNEYLLAKRYHVAIVPYDTPRKYQRKILNLMIQRGYRAVPDMGRMLKYIGDR